MSSCYSNPFPTFQPAMRIVSQITNGDPASITTTIDHDYISGEILRIQIPLGFGMEQMHGLKGEIVVTSSNTFTIDIDTTAFDPFVIPSPLPNVFTCAQCIPIGENNSILIAATKNVLPSGER